MKRSLFALLFAFALFNQPLFAQEQQEQINFQALATCEDGSNLFLRYEDEILFVRTKANKQEQITNDTRIKVPTSVMGLIYLPYMQQANAYIYNFRLNLGSSFGLETKMGLGVTSNTRRISLIYSSVERRERSFMGIQLPDAPQIGGVLDLFFVKRNAGLSLDSVSIDENRFDSLANKDISSQKNCRVKKIIPSK